MFAETLKNWFKKNQRILPWRENIQAYNIWVSEIMLQQTRVDQAIPFYLNFIKSFPDVQSLANADETSILKSWQGLGYYSRARNMHAAAKQVVVDYNGIFPSKYEDLIRIKGIGPYTAAAISSISFNEKKAVVDGNVYRVLARYFSISVPIDSPKGQKEFAILAESLISESEPGCYNQALMELGALICTPRNTNCEACPIAMNCQSAFAEDRYNLPIKAKKIKTRERFFNYFIIESEGKLWMKKRDNTDILSGMYEFYLVESPIENLGINNFENELPEWLKNISLVKVWDDKQVLTHQILKLRYFYIRTNDKLFVTNMYAKEEIVELPKPKMIERIFVEL